MAFVIAMAIQLRIPQYVPWAYWLAVLMVAVFGTMAADVLHVEFHVPYIISTVFFALALTIVFAMRGTGAKGRSRSTASTPAAASFSTGPQCWRRSQWERPPAISPPTTGEMGFLSAGVMFAVVFTLPGIGYRFFKISTRSWRSG